MAAVIVVIPAAAIGSDLSGAGSSAQVDYCPSSEEAQEHLRESGEAYKPTVNCTYDDEGNPTTPEPSSDVFADHSGSDTDHAGGDSTADEMTVAEAQERFDPTNDPNVIVGAGPDGNIVVYEVSMIEQNLPPGMPSLAEANVKTPQDLQDYVDEIQARGGTKGS